MWEYRATDYTDDDIQHWKYIKRYKTSSGKWRYVYADKDTHKLIDRMDSDNAHSRLELEKDRNEFAKGSYVTQKFKNGTQYLGYSSGRKDTSSTSMIARNQALKIMQSQSNKIKTTEHARDSVIEKNSVKNTVNSIKENASKAYNKGKTLVEKLLKKK